MKKLFAILTILFLCQSLLAQEPHEVIQSLGIYPEGVVREVSFIKHPKEMKTSVRFVSNESKDGNKRIGWYEFEVFSEDKQQSGYYKVEKEDLETMIDVVRWMRSVVQGGYNRGELMGAMTKNGWMLWIPKGGGEDIHLSKEVDSITPHVKLFFTSVFANSFTDNPNMEIDVFLQSLIDSYHERLNTPVLKKR